MDKSSEKGEQKRKLQHKLPNWQSIPKYPLAMEEQIYQPQQAF